MREIKARGSADAVTVSVRVCRVAWRVYLLSNEASSVSGVMVISVYSTVGVRNESEQGSAEEL